MKKLAFVAWWEWFEKTKSADFLVKTLKKEFEIKKLSRPDWFEKNNIPVQELNKENFNTILFFFALPPANYLRKLNCKNFVWIPMYDGTNGLRLAKLKFLFYKFFNLKVISFSKKMHYELKPFFNSKYFQYYPKPKKQVNFDNPKLFFWERRDDLDWNFIKNIINQKDFDKITIKQNADGLSKQNKKIKETKKIKILNKWLTDKQYEKILDTHNVFIAPSLKEGIGFSFLHALSRGYIIIANNASTMNEYIKDKKTGFLFDFKKPKKINLNNKKLLKKISNNTYTQMKNGRKIWKTSKKELIKFITN
ncbi:MAG: glycosyltransferase [Candidatus ainarchaeum sp.]|nr:glycosyltransferase [Candidatus ainarchaeum sp.]